MRASEEHQPWRESEEWLGGRATAATRGETTAYWFGALVWNALGIPIGVLAARGDSADVPPSLTYLLPLFTLTGLLIFVGAVRHTLRRRRFKHLELQLDPFPGALGGHAGGTVDLPSIRPSDAEFRAVLLCVHSRTVKTRNSRGTADEVVWSDEMIPTAEGYGIGARLRFTFDVPADLPPTSGEPDDHHYWAVRLTASLPGADLDEVFTVPVYVTHPPRTAEHASLRTPTLADGLPGWSVSARYERGDLRISYRTGRGGFGTIMMIVFGVVFASAGAGIFQSAARLGDGSGLGGVANAFGGLFGAAFVGIGALLLLPGVYLLLNSLEVRIGHGHIESVRSFLGLRRRHAASIDEIARIEASLSGQTGQGAKAVRSYKLRAYAKDGAKIPLGDGIRGDFRLARLVDLVEDVTGLSVERKRLALSTWQGPSPTP